MHLHAGADGQLWLGTSAVRRFELQADTIKLDQNALPPGVATLTLSPGMHISAPIRFADPVTSVVRK